LEVELICTDCWSAEVSLYGAAFDSLANGESLIQPDNAELRDFVVQHSAVTPDDLDIELLKICSISDTFSVDKDGFVALLRENPIHEAATLEQFLGLSQDGENITSEACRTGLLYFMQNSMGTSMRESCLECIIDTVMMDAGLDVSMEQWISYCKAAARIVRAASFASSAFFFI
jgi:hypothetical protein